MVRRDVAERKIARAGSWLDDAQEIFPEPPRDYRATPSVGISHASICYSPSRRAWI